MAPRGRPTRLNPGATPTPVTDTHTTTLVTSAQLQAMIDEGVTAVLAARATTQNGDDSHTSGTGDGRLDPVVMRGWKSEFRISKSTVENQNEIKKLKAELWNLKVKGNQMVVDYNPTFPGNRHCCVTGMFPEETNKIKRSSTYQTSGISHRSIPGVAPVTRAPYRLPYQKMKAFGDNYKSFSDKAFIKTQNKQEHEEHLKIILRVVEERRVVCKLSMVILDSPKYKFLGHVYDNKGIHVDPTKIESVKDWAIP
ncbi:hypothetical protein Tco_0178537 [Tanacetum coccineum]